MADQLHILIVEDNPGDDLYTRGLIGRSRLRESTVHSVRTLGDAFAVLRTMPCDVILLDLTLPDAHGTEAVVSLTTTFPSIPCVILSGQQDDALALEAVRLGAQDYLYKGEFDGTHLEKSIQYSIERGKQRLLVEESEQRYRALFESNPLPMWAYDVHTGSFLMVNAAAIDGYGYSRDWFLSSAIFDLHLPEDVAEVRMYHIRHTDTAGQHRSSEWRHRTGNRGVIDVRIISHDIRLFGKDARLVVAIDITESRDIERHSRLLESVVTNSKDAIMITEAEPVDEPGPRIIYVNKAFTEVTGYHRDEVIGRSPRFLQGPKTDRAELDRIRHSIERHEAVDAEIVNYRKDGSEFWVNLVIFPITDIKGHRTHLISIQRDTTVRRRSESELRSLVDELMTANTDLRQFSFIASHNMRGPVANLLGLIDLFDVEGKDPRTNSEILTRVSESVTGLDRTIQELVRMLMVKNTRNMNVEVFDFNHVLTDVTSAIENLILEKKVMVVSRNVDLQPGLRYVRSHVVSILQHLITNSIQYAHPERNPIVTISANRMQGNVFIDVADNGLGIDLDRHGDRLFGMYQRFHSGSEGRGLGLYIVKSQVEAMGGSISVTSVVGRGTTFHIRLKEHKE